ncbi:putative inositol catabolism protein [Arthrobacter globiformis NBRC 12137]|jgi:inosose dehydratase|uniref:Putative inositol catabolism protein n=1 Tax=Arthrobacter globiformis (strain ATCC 8010 / DSM 20124 / JCM 1332 / NBRC 12137 / NCIMB 8907 / NRRL B-2979 / 168) TaxID=1077972 RepID=H0QL74_ARTG1|nr:sugar phosphate isomerase/epimerase [Arthrobacter globiformis]GAB13575.1 putative inositol catabolism protein [Arthrobacter globiformis NBRC 12137]
MKLGYPTITWGGVVGMPGGVTSVKDSFYLTAGSTADAFRDIAAAGYTGTEVFDGNLLEFVDEPQSFTHLLEETGLTLVSVYTGANFIFDDIVNEEMAKIEKAAAMAATFGAQRLVIGGGAQRAHGPADGDFQRLASGLDRCTEIASAAGLTATYHPHLGTLVETSEALTKIMKLSGIHFCPDTAHLAGGGGNPAELIRRYSDRLAHVHLKDWDSRSQRFMPLGEGELDFNAILQAIRETGYDDWLMVELDYYDGDPKTAAEISKRYLDKLLATQTS